MLQRVGAYRLGTPRHAGGRAGSGESAERQVSRSRREERGRGARDGDEERKRRKSLARSVSETGISRLGHSALERRDALALLFGPHAEGQDAYASQPAGIEREATQPGMHGKRALSASPRVSRGRMRANGAILAAPRPPQPKTRGNRADSAARTGGRFAARRPPTRCADATPRRSRRRVSAPSPAVRGVRDQRWLKSGLRFSTKAAIPSFWSSVANSE